MTPAPRRRTRRSVRTAGLLAVLGVVAGLLAGCDSGSADEGADPVARSTALTIVEPAPTPRLPVTVPSYVGPAGGPAQVEVTDVSRILPLSANLSETVFSLGLGDRVVGRDQQTTFAEAAGLPLVTRGSHEVSAESALSLRPTVVLAPSDVQPPEVMGQLRKAGVPVVVFEQTYALEDVAKQIRAVAAALGVPDAGEELVERTAVDLASVPKVPQVDGRPAKVAFLYVRGSVSLYLVGGDGSGADDLIEAVGAEDVGSSLGLESFTPLTPEAMVKAQPDVILVMTKGEQSVGGEDGVIRLPGVALTPAGRERRVVAMEDGQLLSFGPRTAQTLHLLSEKLTAELA